MRVGELAPGDRPREKLMRAGATALGDNELVALLLGAGLPDRDAVEVAGQLLAASGGVRGLAGAGADALRRVAGVGAARAARVVAAVELGRRCLAGRGEPRPRLTDPAAVAAFLMPRYGGHPVERFGVVLLDVKQRLLRTTVVSVGTLDASVVHPRDVFREAVTASAAALVLFHNHPSGDPSPSADDVMLTRRLVQAGHVMGIAVVDHVILGEGRWFSFREGMPSLVER
jgi:DNA repair protein RadC